MGLAVLAASALLASQSAAEAAAAPDSGSVRVVADAAQMLDLSERALANGREDYAREILQALLSDVDLRVRNEARFRLAMLAMRQQAWIEAGTYLRAILDEEPTAQRARLELAAVQAQMGDLAASRRTLREAQAGGLPPEVARLVDRFSAALRERRRFGGSFQVSFAPDSNVNRGTNSETLGTVIGEFDLDDDARSNSGIGLSLRSEAFARQAISNSVSLLATGGFSSDLYPTGKFNDVLLFLSAGPEFTSGSGRSRLLGGVKRRWFGGERYADSISASFDWERPLGRVTQLRAAVQGGFTNRRAGSIQDYHELSASVGLERALSARMGCAASISGSRQWANDPGYSGTSGALSVAGWRDLRWSTLIASATYQHYEADKRLAIYPRRRVEDSLQLTLAATFRALQVKGWAPQVRVLWERNASPVEIYRYSRLRAEIGVVRAF